MKIMASWGGRARRHRSGRGAHVLCCASRPDRRGHGPPAARTPGHPPVDTPPPVSCPRLPRHTTNRQWGGGRAGGEGGGPPPYLRTPPPRPGRLTVSRQTWLRGAAGRPARRPPMVPRRAVMTCPSDPVPCSASSRAGLPPPRLGPRPAPPFSRRAAPNPPAAGHRRAVRGAEGRGVGVMFGGSSGRPPRRRRHPPPPARRRRRADARAVWWSPLMVAPRSTRGGSGGQWRAEAGGGGQRREAAGSGWQRRPTAGSGAAAARP